MLCPTTPSLPWVAWASLPHLHRYSAPLRLPAVPLGGCAGRSPSRYLACFTACVVSLTGACPGGSTHVPPGLVGTRSPSPGRPQGDRGLSHVPEFPLWLHAPLSDPGGVPHTRPIASGTAAFRSLDTVGFPLDPLLRAILLATTLRLAGLNHAAGLLATPGSVRPLAGRHAGALLTGWLNVRQVGLEPWRLAPTG